MKIRNGFVSNSSSSSFIIGSKEPLTEDILTKALGSGVRDSSPIAGLAGMVSNVIFSCAEPIDEEGFLDNYCYENLKDAVDNDSQIAKLLSEGYIVYVSTMESDAGGLETALSDGLIRDFETEDVIVKFEGF